MTSSKWRGAALCAAVALIAPSTQPVGQTFVERLQGSARYLLAPARHQVVPAFPPRSTEPLPAPAPGPTALERTRTILEGQAARTLGGSVEELAVEIVDLSQRYGVEPELILAMIQAESSFRPGVRSRKGAVGLMQLLPRTARPLAAELGIPWRGSRTLRDPVVNVRLGVHYLARLRDRFDGDLDLAVSAYNLGPSRVDRYLRKGRRPRWYAGKVESCRRQFAAWTDDGVRPRTVLAEGSASRVSGT